MSLHQGQPVLSRGAAAGQAKAGLVLVHGRGASAEDIFTLTESLDVTGVACRAPQAAGQTWYPYRFLEPVEKNEPYLTSALVALDDVLVELSDADLPREKVIVLGFSQGACLTLEYAARHPRRYGGVVALTGGLIGNGDRPRDYTGSLDNTPVFIGCSDQDFHIPASRVHESSAILRNLGAQVEERLYPNMGHTVNADELQFVQAMLNRLTGA